MAARHLSAVAWPVFHPVDAFRSARRWIGNSASGFHPVFVVGAPRSGTTLLKTILVAHPRMAGTDYESSGVFRYRNLEQYRIDELEQEKVRAIIERTTQVVPLFEQLAQAVLERHGADVFVDKLTVRSWRLKFVSNHFPHARFINIVRDGRDCLCSARRHPNVLQSETVSMFARYWKSCVETPLRTIPIDRLTTVTYEELTRQPEETLGELMSVLGLTFEASQIDPQIYMGTTSMHKRDVHKNLAREINTQSHERWRSDLSAEDQAAFCAIAGSSLREYGYKID